MIRVDTARAICQEDMFFLCFSDFCKRADFAATNVISSITFKETAERIEIMKT